MKRATSFVLCLAMVCGCGDMTGPRVDATSEETLQASMKKMTAGMSQEDQRQLAEDCMTVVIAESGGLADLMMKSLKAGSDGKDPTFDAQTDLMKPLHGLTLAQIRAKAAAVRAQQGK